MPDPTAAAACVYVYPEGGVCGIAAAHHGEQLGIRTHGFQPATAGLRLVCPYCGDGITAELTYTAQYTEHRDLTGYECDNYKCDARWTARGDVARLPRSLCAT